MSKFGRGPPSKPREGAAPFVRVPTGIGGLDAITQGGFRIGGIFMVLGPPGAGKTILGNQMAFHHVATGGRALFVTLLTESHARMLGYLQALDFFDSKAVGTTLHYLSGYQILQKEKLPGLLRLLTKAIRSHRTTLLVLDGFVTAGAVAESEVELKRFIQELQVLLEILGCTAVVLTGAQHQSDQYAVRTMVDGLLEVRYDPEGMDSARSLELVKARGGPTLPGRHRFDISNRGITVYPRIETIFGVNRRQPESPVPAAALAFGIRNLDHMMAGGVRPASVTTILGASGTGKTLLGLNFLASGARAKEAGLYVGFSETPDELRRNLKGLPAELAESLGDPLIAFDWRTSNNAIIADALAAHIIARAREGKVRRLFVDGMGRIEESLPDRVLRFVAAFCNELRSLGVATLLSEETRDLIGPDIALPLRGLAAIPDNIVLIRHVELEARLHRLISILKMRGVGIDSSLREFSIGSAGIEVSSTFGSAQAILTGSAQVRPDTRKRTSSPSGSAGQPAEDE